MKRHIKYILILTLSVGMLASGCKKKQAHMGNDQSAANSGAPAQGAAAPANGTPQNGAQTGTQPVTLAESINAASKTISNTSMNSGIANSPSTPAIEAGVTPTNGQTATVVAAPQEVPVTCFVESFKHKATPGHTNEEACSHHKNLVKLTHPNVNGKSVCVRVNNVPVKYERLGNGSEILIGSIAGPQAVITVKYCTGKTSCPEIAKNDCVIPKDEFLDAIGGSDTDENTSAQWDNTSESDSNLNSEVKRELADIDDAAPENHVSTAAIFKDWLNDKTAPACKKQPS